MAINSAVGSFNTGTGAVGTTVVVSGLGFQPKVVFFWWSGRTDTTDAVGRRTAQRGFGAAVSASDRRRVTTLSEDTPTAMLTNRSQDDTEAIALTTTSDTIDGLLDVQSIDSGGFTLVVDDVFTASYRIHYLALGGADITNVEGGSFTKDTVTGNQDITSLSFQPDLVLFFGVGQTSMAGTVSTDSRFSMGAMDSAGRQAVYAGGSNDGAGTSQAMSYANDVECFAQFDTALAAIQDRAAYVAMLSNGFRIDWVENTGATSDVINFVALKGGSYRVDSLLTQTDTTTDIVESGFGFQPAAAMFVSHNKAESTADTPQDDDEWSVGAFSSTTARAAMATTDDDAAGTAIVSSAVEHDEVYINLNANTGAIEGLMDIKSIDSGGFTCIMDDADPSQAFVWYIAFGPTPGGTDTPKTITVTANITNTITKNVGKPITRTVTSTPSISKGLAAIISLVVTTAITALKGVVSLKTITVAVSSAKSVLKDIGKPITRTVTTTLTRNTNIPHVVLVSITQILFLNRDIAKTITRSVTETVTAIVGRGYYRTIELAVTISSLIHKNIVKPIALTESVIVALQPKEIGKLVAVVANVLISSTMTKALLRTITAAVVTSNNISRDIQKTFSVIQTTIVEIQRSLTLLVAHSINIPVSLSVQRQILLTKAVIVNTLTIVSRLSSSAFTYFNRNVRTLTLSLKDSTLQALGKNTRIIHLRDTDNDDN